MGNKIEPLESSKICIDVFQYGENNKVDTTYLIEDFVQLDSELSYHCLLDIKEQLEYYLNKIEDSEK